MAVAAIEARFFANLCRALGCEQWIEHQYDDDVQDALRRGLAAAFALRSRDDWVAELSGADTCVAPVQAVSWGHPETSGLPTMDFYLSAQDLEPQDA